MNEPSVGDQTSTLSDDSVQMAFRDPASVKNADSTVEKLPTPPKSPVLVASRFITMLFSENISAKIWGIALRGLNLREPPVDCPEYTDPQTSRYIYSSMDFWTSGFFPGCLYLLYERLIKWEHISKPHSPPQIHISKLKHACKWWTHRLHREAVRTDTHDLGFMIMPWAQIGWEIDGDKECLQSMIAAAYALASRYNKHVGAIRSWDRCVTKRYQYNDPDNEFLVIIDSMMNMNLLFYVAKLVNNPALAAVAQRHATTLLDSHLRADDSTYHVVDFDQHRKSTVKSRFTNQGYSDTSCWSRGQAWGIAGYAQTYGWTREPRFLHASSRLADYFLAHLPEDGVPYWDFGAPIPGPRDTSAGLVAAYGMLLLHQHLQAETSKYLTAAMRLIEGVTIMSLAPEARFVAQDGIDLVEFSEAETIVLNATINNHEFAPKRWANHGLVYADYYFLLIGNTLADMRLAQC